MYRHWFGRVARCVSREQVVYENMGTNINTFGSQLALTERTEKRVHFLCFFILFYFQLFLDNLFSTMDADHVSARPPTVQNSAVPQRSNQVLSR